MMMFYFGLLLCKGGPVPAVNAPSHSMKSVSADRMPITLSCGVVATLMISKLNLNDECEVALTATRTGPPLHERSPK